MKLRACIAKKHPQWLDLRYAYRPCARHRLTAIFYVKTCIPTVCDARSKSQGACGWRRGVSLLSAQNRNGRARAASGRQWLTCDLDEGADPASVTATRATAVALRFCKVSCACAPHTRRVHGISVRVYACTWGTLGMRLKRRRSHLTPGKRCACTMDRKHSCHEAISKTDHNH